MDSHLVDINVDFSALLISLARRDKTCGRWVFKLEMSLQNVQNRLH